MPRRPGGFSILQLQLRVPYRSHFRQKGVHVPSLQEFVVRKGYSQYCLRGLAICIQFHQRMCVHSDPAQTLFRWIPDNQQVPAFQNVLFH